MAVDLRGDPHDIGSDKGGDGLGRGSFGRGCVGRSVGRGPSRGGGGTVLVVVTIRYNFHFY